MMHLKTCSLLGVSDDEDVGDRDDEELTKEQRKKIKATRS